MKIAKAECFVFNVTVGYFRRGRGAGTTGVEERMNKAVR